MASLPLSFDEILMTKFSYENSKVYSWHSVKIRIKRSFQNKLPLLISQNETNYAYQFSNFFSRFHKSIYQAMFITHNDKIYIIQHSISFSILLQSVTIYVFSILNSLHLLLIIENKLQYLELDRKQSLDIRNFRFTKAYELAGRGGLIVIPRPWYRETQAQSFPRASSWNYYGSFRSSRGYKSFESI